MLVADVALLLEFIFSEGSNYPDSPPSFDLSNLHNVAFTAAVKAEMQSALQDQASACDTSPPQPVCALHISAYTYINRILGTGSAAGRGAHAVQLGRVGARAPGWLGRAV